MENENDPLQKAYKDFDRKAGFIARMGCSVIVLIISVILVIFAIIMAWALLKS